MPLPAAQAIPLPGCWAAVGQEGAETPDSASGVSLLARAPGCADPGSRVLAALVDCRRERGANVRKRHLVLRC